VLGYISVLITPHNEELAFMAIEQAALVLALAVAKERELSEVEGGFEASSWKTCFHGPMATTPPPSAGPASRLSLQAATS